MRHAICRLSIFMRHFSNSKHSLCSKAQMALPHFKVYLPLDSDEEAKKGALSVLSQLRKDWSPEAVRFHFFTEGITNRILSAHGGDPTDRVLFRIFGRNTELIIDRETELSFMRLLHNKGLSPPVYGTLDNGLVYGFVAGSVLDVDSVREEPIAQAIAKRMAQMHSTKLSEEEKTKLKQTGPLVLVKATAWIDQLPETFPEPERAARYTAYPRKDELRAEIAEWSELLKGLASPLVLAHNDLLLKNIVWDAAADEANFIDFEYAGLNYQAFDIGDHFSEYAGVDDIDFTRYPDEAYQKKWLAHYLKCFKEAGGTPETEDIHSIFISVQVGAAVAHFFWGVWAIIQAANSTLDFDFLQYGLDRMAEYKKLKAAWFAEAKKRAS